MGSQRHRSCIVRMLAAVLGWAAWFLSPPGLAQPIDDSRTVLRFDAGPHGSLLLDNFAPLYCDSAYTPQTGFGWTRPPTGEFARPDLSRSRSALTIDGVTGNRLSWRADVAPGDWNVTVWLESAASPPPPLRVLIQGRRQLPGWQKFSPPAEPKQSTPKTYRVFHSATRVGPGGFSLELLGAEQEVRLLGLSLIRRSHDSQPAHQEFLSQLTSAGRHDSSAPLSELGQQARNSLLETPADPFFATWQERLELLAAAERYVQMRGWQWADEETGLGMFDRLYQAVMLVDGLLAADATRVQPLAERARYLRGRVLYWLHREMAGADERAGAGRDLQGLYARYPGDKMLAMYVGQKIDLPDACDCLPAATAAPAWSVAQREALCRMRQIAHWWVDEQQTENGEFGGKMGDDVELLRWWAPLVLAGDRTALAGWERLANGVWSSEHIQEGYAAKLSDVEHAAEFVADTAPLMAIYSDAPRYQQRLAWSAKHFEHLWTGFTPPGHRFFRSAWFSASSVQAEPPKDRDVEYNTRAVQALRYLAWRQPNAQLTNLLHQWSQAWVSAALRTDKGKPRGIIPASVRFADEAFNGDEPTWYLPNMFWKYYQWEHYVGSLMLDQLLFTFSLTGDQRLLEPMRLSLDLIRAEEAHFADPDQVALEVGSPTWAAENLVHSELFWNVVQQWRLMTDDPRWDELILRYGTPYGQYRLSGDERYLVAGLEQLLAGVRYNTPLLTTEAIHTDRVYVPQAELLKAMLTGDGVKDNVSPYFAVSWEETDENFTALVSDAGVDRLTVKLYSHSPVERRIVMRIWQLAPGKYRLRSEAAETESRDKSIDVRDLGQRIRIALPSRRLLSVRLERILPTQVPQ